ncbi:MAG: hypothetical protein KAZ30_04210 [Candidatus Magasanikbacteria bacterium]|nr:hypothetical protein [Candidatus Magasanikbacteria bacterium]
MNQEVLKGMVMTIVVSVVTSAIVGGTIFYSLSGGDDYGDEKTYLKKPVTTEQNAMMDQKKLVEKKKGPMGVPGGELQSEEAVKLELVMLKNTIVDYNCTQSGGTFKDLKCTCPKIDGEQLSYDSETGYCMEAFGIPGGELGQTERKLQELVMMKKQ